MEQETIERLNSLTEKQQINIVLGKAKEFNWKIYLNIRKKALKDRKNFHILTDNEIMLQRMENKNYMNKSIVVWSMVKKDTNERVSGDYGTIICKFVEEYEKTHKTICL